MFTSSVKELVNAKEGLVSRRIFVDEEIYRHELERIFTRCWLFLGHEGDTRLEGCPGRFAAFNSESGQRNFYAYWAELMSSDNVGEGVRARS